MRIIALIPARYGSKRLPKKNIKLLGGYPLIAWTIRTAQKSNIFESIIVSTDSEEIAIISSSYGVDVPLLRPDYLSTDEASSVDVAIDALNRYENTNGSVDGLMLLQPTSPFRSVDTILKCFKQFKLHNGNQPVVSFTLCKGNSSWYFVKCGSYLEPVSTYHGSNYQMHSKNDILSLNGSIYLISPNDLKYCKTFVPQGTYPYIMDNTFETLDIDTYSDWEVAEKIVEKGLWKGPYNKLVGFDKL